MLLSHWISNLVWASGKNKSVLISGNKPRVGNILTMEKYWLSWSSLTFSDTSILQ